MSNEISISRLQLNNPILNYRVYEDSTTNIDFLLEAPEEPEDPDAEGYALAIPEFNIQSATINYRDDVGDMTVSLDDLNADISLQFADLIESTVDATLGSLSATVGGANYVDNLSLSLNQTSTLILKMKF